MRRSIQLRIQRINKQELTNQLHEPLFRMYKTQVPDFDGCETQKSIFIENLISKAHDDFKLQHDEVCLPIEKQVINRCNPKTAISNKSKQPNYIVSTNKVLRSVNESLSNIK